MMGFRSLSDDSGRKFFATPRSCLLALFFVLASTIPSHSTERFITQESVEPVLRRHALQHGPWKGDNLELRVLPFAAVALPPGPVSYRVLRSAIIRSGGIYNFYVAAEIAGREAARLWVKAEIRIFQQVVVAAAPLGRQELIAAKDVRLERRELLSLVHRPFTRIDDVIGKQATRAIEANEMLSQNSLDRPTVIKRGSAIQLVYETAGLRAEAAGVAEESGKLGELIQVKNPSSGKILRGVVLDGRNVRIN